VINQQSSIVSSLMGKFERETMDIGRKNSLQINLDGNLTS
jgi:hypothetical protein